jgi:hypothetical protein
MKTQRLLFGLLTTLLAPALAPAQTNTFDTGADGWTLIDNGATGIAWLGSGGNPGGYVRSQDVAESNAWFQAPAVFLGNQSANLGACFKYDIRTDLPGTTGLGHVALQLTGPTNLVLQYPMPPLTGGQWTTVTVPLRASSGWTVAGGGAATDAQMAHVLSDVQSLRIDADLAAGFDNDNTCLDNVAILACDTVLNVRCSEVELCWNSRTNQLYNIQYRSALTGGNWVNLATNILGNGTVNCLTDPVPAGQPQRFYRVEEAP